MSTPEDVNERLTNSLYGNPETLPDERRQYLGSLRERVSLAITVQEAANPRALALLEKHLADFPDQSALINGKVDHQQMGPYLQLLAKENYPFTLINKPETPAANDSLALLIVARQAINQEVIDIFQLYPAASTPLTTKTEREQPTPPEKPGFFSRLFKSSH